MITPAMIYWVNEADTIRTAFWIIVVIGVFFSGFWFSSFSEMEDKADYIKKYRSTLKISLLFTFIFLIMAIFIPSTKTCYEMYIIPTIANSKIVEEMPHYIQEYIEKSLSDKVGNSK